MPSRFRIIFQLVVIAVFSQLVILVHSIENQEPQECADPTQAEENIIETNNKLVFYLAGFLPDGYFERAKERLSVQFAQKYGAEIKQLKSKSEFQSWRTAFLNEKGCDSVEYLKEQWASSSTMVWLENPFQVLGDSDALEDFYLKCFHGHTREITCDDPREFFKQRLVGETIKRTIEKPEIEPWEHEAHQGVRCQYQINDHEAFFYVILLREWSFEAFESFQEALRANKVTNLSSIFKPNGIIQWNIGELRVTPQDEKQHRLVQQRGTLSTNGEHVLLWTSLKKSLSSNSDMDIRKYVPFGYIPEGYLKKHVDYWIKNSLSNVVLTNCQLMTGGLRRVQTILATDGLN